MTAQPSPSAEEDALAVLGKLIASGSSPAQITREIGTLIAGWAKEPEMNPAIAQIRIERLWDSLSKDAADLQEQIADADCEAAQATAQARKALVAMTAAVDALAAAYDRV